MDLQNDELKAIRKTNGQNKEEIILDVIPIYINEMYPKKEEIWHFKNKNENNVEKEIVINFMIEEIRLKFSDYNAVIILEKGKVIEIL